jgi:hypothetical protein
VFCVSQEQYACGGGNTRDVWSLTFRVKIQGPGLISCVWQWLCWRHCFESEDFLQGENIRSMNGDDSASALFPFWRHRF